MKIKNLLITAMLALSGTAFVNSASASAAVVHICGSTAFRAPVTAAIESILASGYTCAYDSSTTSSTAIYGAGEAIFTGTLASNSHAIIIKTFWTGSLAGVVDLVTQNTLVSKFIPSGGTESAGPAGTNVHGAYTAENGVCDVAMSDSLSSSVAKSVSGATVSPSIVVGSNTYASGASIAAAINAATITSGGSLGETTVGVVPFLWEADHLVSGTPPFTNMTQQTALSLIKSGFAPVSMLTGAVGDIQNYMFLIGRNEDSGTRIGANAEGQNGFGSPTIQYSVTFLNGQTSGSGLQTGGAGSSVSSIGQWAANSALNTEPNINWNTTGHSGYVGGGDVSNVMASTNTPTSITFTSGEPDAWASPTSKGYLVGYLGVSDGVGSGSIVSPANNGTILSYNGVTFSAAAVQTGAYSFWTFEHLYYTSTITGDQVQAAKDIADAVFQTYAPTNSGGNTVSAANQSTQVNSAGIIFDVDTTFYFTRTQEGGVITANY